MRLLLHRFAGILSLALSLAACGDATGPTLDDVLAHRAAWSAQALRGYSYNYEVTGFFINWEGQQITVEVRDNTVVSAVFAATGEPTSGSLTDFPTIDELFDQAAQAARDHTLRAIAFDPQLAYPRRLDLAGPPDASGSVFAVKLQPAP